MNDLIILILCHLIGDYVLQSDYIAKTKGENWYHLFVHSALYCVPFALAGVLPDVAYTLFIHHAVIDALKARYKVLCYAADQVFHYLAIAQIWVCGGI